MPYLKYQSSFFNYKAQLNHNIFMVDKLNYETFTAIKNHQTTTLHSIFGLQESLVCVIRHLQGNASQSTNSRACAIFGHKFIHITQVKKNPTKHIKMISRINSSL